MSSIITGILNVDKPAGMTSRRAVDLVARLVKPAKVGHAGTLDPLATGVLVVCIGKATRLIEFIQQMKKRYRGTFLLGRSSPTEDIEGEVTELENPPIPSALEVERAVGDLTGAIEQRPPAFSALKVAGRRAYDLARRGEAVTLAPRQVTVHHLGLIEFRYPKLVLDIECSAGTYVRSLGRDLAQSLGTAAVMSGLTRTHVGDFNIDDAVDPRDLTQLALLKALHPPRAAVADLPMMTLSDGQIEHLAHGRTLTAEAESAAIPEGMLAVAVDQRGEMAAILKREAGTLLSPYVNFVGR